MRLLNNPEKKDVTSFHFNCLTVIPTTKSTAAVIIKGIVKSKICIIGVGVFKTFQFVKFENTSVLAQKPVKI